MDGIINIDGTTLLNHKNSSRVYFSSSLIKFIRFAVQFVKNSFNIHIPTTVLHLKVTTVRRNQ